MFWVCVPEFPSWEAFCKAFSFSGNDEKQSQQSAQIGKTRASEKQHVIDDTKCFQILQ